LVNADGSSKPAGTKTCSASCRNKRARRIKREEKEAALARRRPKRAKHVIAVAEEIENGAALHEATVEVFKPLVREAMTDSVLAGIQKLIDIQPDAIAALQRDLTNEDDKIRQTAYTLLLKYTMGNPSVAPPSTTASPSGLTVQFNLPRPGDDPAALPAPVPADAVTLRACDVCGEEKPEHEFVAGSQRCEVCHDKTRDLLRERFGEAYGG
jgi:hypothetical protein